MTKIKKLLAASLVLLGVFSLTTLPLIPVMLAVPGCTTSQQRVAYNSLYSVETSTTAAYDAYLHSVVLGKVTTNDVPQVTQAFNNFQLAMQAAVMVGQFNMTNAAPSNVTALASNVLSLIVKAKGR